MTNKNNLEALRSSLDRIDWSPENEDAYPEAAALLQSIGSERLLRVASYAVARVLDDEGEQFGQNNVAPHILPNKTHIKYQIGGIDHFADPMGYKLWLHEWRDNPQGNFADVPHNHRYSLAAGPLTQPYVAREWRYQGGGEEDVLQLSDFWLPNSKEWMHPDVITYEPGQMWAMNSLDVHSIHLLNPGSVSIFVQGPRQRSRSCSFDAETGEVLKYFPPLDAPVTD